MKKFIVAAILTLPLTAFGAHQAMADCCTPMYRIGFSLGLVCRSWCGCDYQCCKPHHCKKCCGVQTCGGGGGGPGGGGGMPWYGAWPYPAHFNAPAPTGYGYYPGPMQGMPGTGYAMMPMQVMPYAMTQPMPEGMEQFANPMAMMPAYGNFGGVPMQPQIQPAAYYPQAPAYWYPGQ
jgi:hypothetical protein